MIYDGQPFATPGDALEHFGVKGMRWGVRNKSSNKPPLTGLISEPIVVKTKSGDELTLAPMKVTALHRSIAKVSSKYRENYKTAAHLTIKDKSGKSVGNGSMWLRGKNKEELYLNWIDVDKSARGKGYAQAVLMTAEAKGRSMGAKKMTLEVPGISPDARHIYEKQGFKVTKEAEDAATDSVWGGLTTMEKQLK